MYSTGPRGWLKHWDFIIMDLVCLQLAFIYAYWIRFGVSNPYGQALYRNMAVCIELIDITVLFFLETFSRVLKRGHFVEFSVTLLHCFFVTAFSCLYLFMVKAGDSYSRTVLFVMAAVYFLLTYLTRTGWKLYLWNTRLLKGGRTLLIVTAGSIAAAVIRDIREKDFSHLNLCGLALVDADRRGETVEGVPVVAGAATVCDYVLRQWIDEVLILPPGDAPFPQDILDKLMETGVVVHLNLAKLGDVKGRRQLVERIGSYTVLTTTMNYATPRQAFLKRSLDIAGGLAGSAMALILFVILAPAIRLQSPGPVFFSQIRVGRNGRRFKMYKFRSMYLDAEERKAALLAENRMQDGHMFKLDFDPRVIGNRILPDGTKKTGLGEFIRRTSLDEFPQFFNVLKGDMSLVGTRPPTEDEWTSYELRHRARLAVKPGITGMWQVSGRSDILDFEEVVRLDTQYINEWTLGLDIKILLKTVGIVLRRKGAL